MHQQNVWQANMVYGRDSMMAYLIKHQTIKAVDIVSRVLVLNQDQ